MKNILYWFPRALSLLLIAFISMFALDVLNGPQWFLALLIHLIPSYILVILTVIAWKNEKMGGWLFIAIGLFMLISSRFESLIISVPLMILGMLFLSRKFLFKITINHNNK